MMLEQLRQRLRALEKPARLGGDPGCLPLGIDSIDAVLGGGLARGALHEIAAASEAHLAAATGFTLGLAARARAHLCWIAEDMALAESGALYGGGLDAFRPFPRTADHGRRRAPARSAVGDGGGAALPRHWRRDRRMAAWRHRHGGGAAAVARRGGERRAGADAARRARDRRLHRGDALDRRRRALGRNAHDGPGAPRFAAHLIRNRRGPLGSWILQWSDSDERFLPRACSASGSAGSRPTASRERAARRLRSAPLAVYGKRGNAELIVAVDAAAERLGLVARSGAGAGARHASALEAIAEDTEADAALLDTIADWCLRYTPLIACDSPDGLLLDIGGCAHLYGGEDALIADLAGRLERAGFAFRLAVAGSIGAAWAAAHYGDAGELCRAARSASCCRRCRSPRCGSTARPSLRSPASA